MPAPDAQSSPAYVMTHSERERRRLALQASLINPFTARFLADAGIATGMRVLDLGCGVGDVSLIAARLVGEHGHVTGVDIDPEAVITAEERAADEGLRNLRFQRADLGDYKPQTRYDAVVGRHILIHTSDPIALLSRARSFAQPGGIIAFQEFDLSFFGPKFDGMPTWTSCGEAIATLFVRAGLPVRAGTLLYTWFLEAGLPIPTCRLEFLIGGGENSPYFEWLTETMRSLLPKMLALGVLEPDTIDLEHLEDRLRGEVVTMKRPCVAGPMGGAFVRTPVDSSHVGAPHTANPAQILPQ